MQHTFIIPISGNPFAISQQDPTLTERNFPASLRFCRRDVILELNRDVDVLLDELARLFERDAPGIVDPGPGILTTEHQIRKQNGTHYTVRDAIARVAAVHVDVFRAVRITSRE